MKRIPDPLRAIASHFSVYRRQLGLARAILYLSQKAAVRIIDPYLIPSYSQFGEDRYIEDYFFGQCCGTYVDIGCYEAIRFSNTWKLYLKGWTGLVVDGNPDILRTYKKVRPRDQAVCAVVSDQTSVAFRIKKAQPTLSRVVTENEAADNRKDAMHVRTRRLDDLLKQHEIAPGFDLLSVDVEGHELHVLRSLDLGYYQPRLVVVELHSFNPGKSRNYDVHHHMLGSGYQVISRIGVSNVYERVERDSVGV